MLVFRKYVVLFKVVLQYNTISGSAQSLFALIHGDDVYAAMQNINQEDHPVVIWLVSQVFHYTYCTLFIFAIANLFIAVIMDSYETVKVRYGD